MNTNNLKNGTSFVHYDAKNFEPIEDGYVIKPHGIAFKHFDDAKAYYEAHFDKSISELSINPFNYLSNKNYVAYNNRYLRIAECEIKLSIDESKVAKSITNKLYDLLVEGLTIKKFFNMLNISNNEQEQFDTYCMKISNCIVFTESEEFCFLRMNAEDILAYNIDLLTRLIAPNYKDIENFSHWIKYNENIVYIAEEKMYCTKETQYNDRMSLEQILIYFINNLTIAYN